MHPSCRIVETLLRPQSVGLVGKHPSGLIESDFVSQVVEEDIGGQRHIAVDEAHIVAGISPEFGKFHLSVIVEFVAIYI